MNHIRIYTNILLSACISLLVGCNAQKKAAKGKQVAPEDETMQEEVVRNSDVICLYGIPPEVYEQIHSSDTIPEDTDKRDDVETK